MRTVPHPTLEPSPQAPSASNAITRSRSGTQSPSATATGVSLGRCPEKGKSSAVRSGSRFVGAEVGLADRRRLIAVPPAEGNEAHEQGGDKQPREKDNSNHSSYLAAIKGSKGASFRVGLIAVGECHQFQRSVLQRLGILSIFGGDSEHCVR